MKPAALHTPLAGLPLRRGHCAMATSHTQLLSAPQHLQSLCQLPEKYTAVLLDQFGVLHDGKEPYPGAIQAVSYLRSRGMKLLVLSNSSRRAEGALGNLGKMGFDMAAFEGVVTSGEVTHRVLSQRQGEPWQSLGSACLHFTWAARGAISLEGLGLRVVGDPGQADFVLAHGTEAVGSADDGSSASPCSLEDMRQLLQQCAAKGIPMLVENPDIVTVSGSELRTMPGTLAQWYAEMPGAGPVNLMGKPATIIYEAALQLLGVGLHEVLAVGDSINSTGWCASTQGYCCWCLMRGAA